MSSVFVYDPTEKDPLSKVRGVGRYLQILKKNFPHWQYLNKFEIRNSKFEIFINPFFNFLQPPLVLKRIAKKQIAVIHDLIPLKYPKHFPVGIKGAVNIFLNKLALKNYDLIMTDSEASKHDITNILHIDEDRVKVVYPCLPKIFLNPPSAIRNHKINKLLNDELRITNYCLYVGDATWNKNLVNLAKAVKVINVTCIFVGNVFNTLTRKRVNDLVSYNKWQEEFRQFLKEVENDKRFVFLGYVSDDKLIQLYKQARCNVLVSRDEGFGFSYLEAASQSCPSILADIPVLKEVSNGHGAMFAKPSDVNQIANSLGEIYFNQDLRNKLGKDAKERVKYFNPKKFEDAFFKNF